MFPSQLPLPTEHLAQEPLWASSTQYWSIINYRRHKDRERARAEVAPIERKPYMHESRHKHAARRERDATGRFATKRSKADGDASDLGTPLTTPSSAANVPTPFAEHDRHAPADASTHAPAAAMGGGFASSHMTDENEADD